jgi:hypothetical protein
VERLPSTSLQTPDEGDALSRRKIFRRAVGVAAVGAAGTALAEAIASPARAATQSTTVEPGAVAPAVVALTDAATIAVDASQGNDFRVTIGGDRTLGNPANPTDGQKAVFQITQGTGGNFTLSYGNGYEFGSGLPQPTLSTTAGDTDLLAFVYNAAKGTWLFVAYVIGFASSGTSTPTPTPTTSSPTPTPTTSGPSGTYRLFPSTSGPSTPVSYSGSFLAGVLFEATTGGCYFDGYWWWVCPSGQSTAAQTFALWEVYNDGVGTLIQSATATSGSLTAGQWNYVPLETPVPLAIGVSYNACTGFSGSFPDTNGQYGSGGPYSAGIVNGPLTAFSDQSGTLPAPFSNSQGLFGVGGTNPTTMMPGEGSDSSNFWMDLQLGTTAPTGSSYRLWPNYPSMQGQADGTTIGYTLATEFTLSQTCTLDNIWFYTPPDAAALPTRCGIWSVSSQTEVSGTDNSSPSWTGAAASGWVSCAYSGVTLPAGDYKVAVFYGGGSKWFLATTSYWGSGAGENGITTGPLTAPGLSTATSPGQSTYNQGSWAYPLTYGSGGNGENYWVDVEVTPT